MPVSTLDPSNIALKRTGFSTSDTDFEKEEALAPQGIVLALDHIVIGPITDDPTLHVSVQFGAAPGRLPACAEPESNRAGK